MGAFLVSVIGIGAGVWLARYLRQRGVGKSRRIFAGVAAWLLTSAVLAAIFIPGAMSDTSSATARTVDRNPIPPAGQLDDGGPSGLEDGKWHDTPLGSASAVKKPKLTDRSTYAWVVCKNAVEEQLRSPSTADFPWTPDASRMVAGDDKHYVILGHVDAQNGYGATVRADWNCEATYKGEGREVLADSSWVTNVVLQSR